MIPFIKDNYGGFDSRFIEFWELNENITNLVLYRIEKMELNIDNDFKVNSSELRRVYKEVCQSLLSQGIQIRRVLSSQREMRLWSSVAVENRKRS